MVVFLVVVCVWGEIMSVGVSCGRSLVEMW